MLTLRDESGAPPNAAQDSLVFTVNAAPLAYAGPDVTVAPGQAVTLDGTVTAWRWTLPDSNVQAGPLAQAVFAEPWPLLHRP